MWRSGDRADVPALEELIAACGTEFHDFELLEHTQPVPPFARHGRDSDRPHLLTDAVGSSCETVAPAQPDGR